MKRLYLLRHAKSSWDQPGVSDKERALNARGIRACSLLGDYFRGAGITPDRIWCSTARRTRETLERIAGRAGWRTEAAAVTFADDLYLASPDTIAAHVRQTVDTAMTVVVIGHNSGIEDLARALVGRDPAGLRGALANKYPTGGLAVFDIAEYRWSALAEGSCTLRAFMTPRALEETAAAR